MEQTVVVRLLGRTIGYRALLNRIQSLWKPIGSFQVIDIENDYFLVKFSMNQDYNKALTEGHWVVYGNYLTMRILGFPYRFYNEKLLRIIVETVGRVVKHPLKAFVGINGVPYCIKYEGFSSICYKCSCYGHYQEKCPKFVKDIDLPYPILNESRPSPPKAENMAVGHSGFAPWMQATGRKRRSAKQIAINKYGKSIVVEKATSKNTRFNILADMEEPDIGQSSGSGTEKMAKFTKNVNGRKIEKGKGVHFKEGTVVEIMELTKTKEVAAKQIGNETIEVGQGMDRTGIITRSTEMLGPIVDASGGPSGLKAASLDCHNSVILEQPTSLKNACHRAMIIVKDNDKKGDGRGMHEPCKNKGLTAMKQKALSIKEMTKKDTISIILRLVGLEFEKMASNELALEGFERLEFDSSKGQEVEGRRQ
ncbi:hypothetical protein Godav_019520 [Gossypium davidsonii]|uniref:CCHC-type domain-containing protein n=2 Tax=Gossypium TaxID=3633 RepID=A0A7J8R042_GOSDV|nr:hypothetical protein [Gossypium davidsonii]MBA0673466.1 hypothetical protein [Gossypium klotzschianum]